MPTEPRERRESAEVSPPATCRSDTRPPYGPPPCSVPWRGGPRSGRHPAPPPASAPPAPSVAASVAASEATSEHFPACLAPRTHRGFLAHCPWPRGALRSDRCLLPADRCLLPPDCCLLPSRYESQAAAVCMPCVCPPAQSALLVQFSTHPSVKHVCSQRLVSRPHLADISLPRLALDHAAEPRRVASEGACRRPALVRVLVPLLQRFDLCRRLALSSCTVSAPLRQRQRRWPLPLLPLQLLLLAPALVARLSSGIGERAAAVFAQPTARPAAAGESAPAAARVRRAASREEVCASAGWKVEVAAAGGAGGHCAPEPELLRVVRARCRLLSVEES
mmetsp:Transcript_18039/g.57497  ORF Transcript_18039/g.57497 Transcript_18039/m.57497 type:complete len:335 (-) Transcript_18039:220-1224(-)